MSNRRKDRYFDTEQEALEHKEKHQLYVMVPNLCSNGKWALIFDLECHIQVIPHTQPN
ncbi:hypothetical protein [Comamonas thiooxydans]|uniref:hypothetical protein n=1 Tax=Comamonas thiooxydans TaxID=363952 RepID=UPI001552FFB8|nr:hypothetical protein [Comamonas thiooxydans]